MQTSSGHLLLIFILGACGGATRTTAIEEGSNGGGSGFGGNPPSGGVAGTGMLPIGSGGTCVHEPSVCVYDCGRESETIAPTPCANGGWRCEDGSFRVTDCPIDSCRRSHTYCCDSLTGSVSSAACDEEQWLCPGETTPFKKICSPSALKLLECRFLSGNPCDSPEWRCSEGGDGTCGSLCECIENSGTLRWACNVRLCGE